MKITFPRSAIRVSWTLTLLAPFLSITASAQDRALAGHIVSVSGKVIIRQESGQNAKELRAAQPGKEIFVGDIITTPSDGRIKLLLKDRSIMEVGPSSLFKLDSMKSGAGQQREVDATVAYGSLRAAVTQKLEGKAHFKVRTSSATMGVRGTEFVVKSEVPDLRRIQQVLNSPPGELPKVDLGSPSVVGKTEVTVLQGKVEVGTPQNSRAPAGNSGGPSPGSGGALLLPGMQLVTGSIGRAGLDSANRPSGGAEFRKLDTQKLAEVASDSRAPDKTFEQAVTIKGATRDEERREEARESKREERKEEQPTQTASTDGKKETESSREGDGSRQDSSGARQESSTTAENSSSGGSKNDAPATDSGSSSTASRAPASSEPASAPSASSGSGLSVIAGAVSTNVQTATTIVQTIRPMDVTVGAINSNTAVTQEAAPVQQIHSLSIRLSLPSP
jgi:hypothetical protein